MSTTTQQPANHSVTNNLFAGAAGITAATFGQSFLATLQAAVYNLYTILCEIQTQQDATVAEAEKTKKGGKQGAMGYYFQALAKAGQGLIGLGSSAFTLSKQNELGGEISTLSKKSNNLAAFEGLAKEPAPAAGAGAPLTQDRLDALLQGNAAATPADLDEFALGATAGQRAQMLQKITEAKNELSLKQSELSKYENGMQTKTRAAEAAVGAGGDVGQGFATMRQKFEEYLGMLDSAVGTAAQGSLNTAREALNNAIGLLKALLEAQKGTSQATARS